VRKRPTVGQGRARRACNVARAASTREVTGFLRDERPSRHECGRRRRSPSSSVNLAARSPQSLGGLSARAICLCDRVKTLAGCCQEPAAPRGRCPKKAKRGIRKTVGGAFIFRVGAHLALTCQSRSWFNEHQ